MSTRRQLQSARVEIDAIESAVRSLLHDLDEAREAAQLSKAALAESVNLPPETIRRLFTAEGQNPTAATLVKLAHALGARIALVPEAKAVTRTRLKSWKPRQRQPRGAS